MTLDEKGKASKEETETARIGALATLEREVRSRLPKNQIPPGELVDAALKRVGHAPSIFGRIEIHGRTEMSPVWRALLSRIGRQTDVVWVAEARQTPDWLSKSGIAVETRPASEPEVRTVSCASPRHEILESPAVGPTAPCRRSGLPPDCDHGGIARVMG